MQGSLYYNGTLREDAVIELTPDGEDGVRVHATVPSTNPSDVFSITVPYSLLLPTGEEEETTSSVVNILLSCVKCVYIRMEGCPPPRPHDPHLELFRIISRAVPTLHERPTPTTREEELVVAWQGVVSSFIRSALVRVWLLGTRSPTLLVPISELIISWLPDDDTLRGIPVETVREVFEVIAAHNAWDEVAPMLSLEKITRLANVVRRVALERGHEFAATPGTLLAGVTACAAGVPSMLCTTPLTEWVRATQTTHNDAMVQFYCAMYYTFCEVASSAEWVIEAAKPHPSAEPLQEVCVTYLSRCSMKAHNHSHLVAIGAIQSATVALERFPNSHHIQHDGCVMIATLLATRDERAYACGRHLRVRAVLKTARDLLNDRSAVVALTVLDEMDKRNIEDNKEDVFESFSRRIGDHPSVSPYCKKMMNPKPPSSATKTKRPHTTSTSQTSSCKWGSVVSPVAQYANSPLHTYLTTTEVEKMMPVPTLLKYSVSRPVIHTRIDPPLRTLRFPRPKRVKERYRKATSPAASPKRIQAPMLPRLTDAPPSARNNNKVPSWGPIVNLWSPSMKFKWGPPNIPNKRVLIWEVQASHSVMNPNVRTQFIKKQLE